MAYEISKSMRLEMGHRLPNHNGKCSSIHGHSYFVELFVSANTLKEYGSEEGMVIDFSAIKQAMGIIDTVFDHALCLSVDDVILPSIMIGSKNEIRDYIIRVKDLSDVYHTFSGIGNTRLVLIKKPPTAEVLGTIWLHILQLYLKENVAGTMRWHVSKLLVKETDSSTAVITANSKIEDHFLDSKKANAQ